MQQTTVEEQHTGLIGKWIGDRGFGFLRDDRDDRDVFFHCKDIKFNEDQIRIGLSVSFDLLLGDDKTRQRAIRVRLVE
jgi:cold shock CspA family protein